MYNSEFDKWLFKQLSKEYDSIFKSPNKYSDVKPQPKVERIRLKRADVLAMIDLALMTNDREWFNELTDKLSAMPV